MSTSDRMHRCPVHGTYYRESAGCPSCADGQPATVGLPERRSSPRVSPVMLVAVLALAGAGYLVARGVMARAERTGAEDVAPADSGNARFEEDLPRGAVPSPRIDPERYRSQIAALEAILYSADSATFDTPRRVEQAAQLLGNAILRGGMMERSLAVGILGFGNTVGSSTDIGYQSPDVARFRPEWERVRAQVFRDAPWFRRSQ